MHCRVSLQRRDRRRVFDSLILDRYPPLRELLPVVCAEGRAEAGSEATDVDRPRSLHVDTPVARAAR